MKHLIRTKEGWVLIAAAILGILLLVNIFISYANHSKLTEPFVINTNTITNVLSMNNKPIALSDASKAALTHFGTLSESIVGVQLVAVQPKRNTRNTVFLNTKAPELASALKTLGEPVPIFIEGNEFNNTRMIAMMNGEFWCYSSANTLVVQVVPQVQPLAPVMCSIAVPPNGREFSGYINLFMSRTPIATEVEDYRTRLTALAASIYARDTK